MINCHAKIDNNIKMQANFKKEFHFEHKKRMILILK